MLLIGKGYAHGFLALENNSQIIKSYTTGTLPVSALDGEMVLATDGEGIVGPAIVYHVSGSWYRASDNLQVSP